MVMLVSLQQASDHLRRDDDADNNDLTLKIKAASKSIIRYLKDGATFLDSQGDVEVDSSGDPIGVPEDVQSATLIMLGWLYRDRDAMDDRIEYATLPKAVTALLYPLRKPTME